MTHLDGNVLAGPLSELFVEDMTMASAQCTHCGNVAVLAQALVYDSAPGWCVRCHTCGEVLLTLVTVAGRVRLDLSGITALEVRAP